MILERLSLANFRGFEQIDLTLEPDATVIAGINGVGKSGILQALAALFSRALPRFTPSTAAPIPFSGDDIRHGRTALDVSAVFMLAGMRYHVGLQRTREDEQRREGLMDRLEELREKIAGATSAATQQGLRREQNQLRSLLGDEGERSSLFLENVGTEQARTGGLEATDEATQQILREQQEAPNQPSAVLFATSRRFEGQPRSLPPEGAFDISNAYTRALQERIVDLRELMHWLHVLQTRASRRHAASTHLLRTLRRAVTEFIPEFSNPRVESEPRLRLLVDKGATPLAVNQLSDGEQGLLAIIFDLTRRLVIANPKLKDPVAEGQAVVLIDEIELHLHPEWQREILRRFTQTFKRCQFVVTSHSPQVLGEVEHRCIRFLVRDGAEIVPWTPPRSLGLDSSRVLEELMEVRARNAQIEGDLQALFRLIDDEDFAAAGRSIEALETTLGPDDPELTRARSLIAFLGAVD